MRHLSWDEFDAAVQWMAAHCDGAGCRGVFGLPRGGLCLAVALSHRLEVPLLRAVEPGCLVVDDVYETGRTLEPIRVLPDVRTMVWISKVQPTWWQAVEVTPSSEWIVFPWENAAVAAADELAYRSSRALT